MIGEADLAERECRAEDFFDAEQVKRVDNSDGVDDAINCTHFVKMHLAKKKSGRSTSHMLWVAPGDK